MKNLKAIIVLGLIGVLTITGCNDFLDVQPKDKFLESQVYETQAGIQNALNGLYIDISTPNLYGRNMTMGAVDLLAQYYNVTNINDPGSPVVGYDYGDNDARNFFDNAWKIAYESVLNTNVFIKKMSNSTNLIPKADADLLRGEAIGIRAMVQFDMLRLFGPVYSKDSTAISIPYYAEPNAEPNELLPANEVIAKVLADLKEAETLLENDPIITDGVQTSLTNTGEDFFRYRNRRMNYYAVKALEARVQLYAGHTNAAYQAATFVINNAQQTFPWIEPTDILSAGGNPNRVFSSEIIFGIRNASMYQQQNNLFDANLFLIWAPLSSRLEDTFENNTNDYRYNPIWIQSANGGKSYKTFFKYADIQDANAEWRYFQPLIRISEMYYITAETDPNPTEGLAYVDSVRFHRGLDNLPPTADLNDELEKEYRKEFYGEGQTFFYYKRKDVGSIPTATSQYGSQSMGSGNYVVPLPESETKYRN